MQLCQWAGVRLLGLNDHEGLWSKKEEFWRNKQNGDFPGKTFYKGTSYLFQQTSISGKNVLKEISYKTDLWEKDLKAFISFHTGYRCFRKYTRVMKSYKIFLIFFSESYRVFQKKSY